jgi:hypothetical protein
MKILLALILSPLLLHAQPVPAVSTGPDTGAILEIITNPPGAKITLDGIGRGVSPATLPNLAPGPHELFLYQTGLFPEKRVFTAEAGKKVSFTIDLKTTAFLTISTGVPEAVILVNGANVGRDSLEKCVVPAGEVTIRVEAPEYEPYEMALVLNPGEKGVLMPTLVPKPGAHPVAVTRSSRDKKAAWEGRLWYGRVAASLLTAGFVAASYYYNGRMGDPGADPETYRTRRNGMLIGAGAATGLIGISLLIPVLAW